MKTVLDGFDFAGTAPLDAEGGIATHGVQPKEFPRSFKSGRHYVFHLRRGRQISHQDLLARLRGVGARLLKAPASPADLVHLVVGGPLFSIEFQLQGRQGRLFNALDPEILQKAELGREWHFEDLVLTFAN